MFDLGRLLMTASDDVKRVAGKFLLQQDSKRVSCSLCATEVCEYGGGCPHMNQLETKVTSPVDYPFLGLMGL